MNHSPSATGGETARITVTKEELKGTLVVMAGEVTSMMRPGGNRNSIEAIEKLAEDTFDGIASSVEARASFSHDALVILLKGTAYNLWKATLCAGPKSISDLFNELKDPKPGDLAKPGDLVMELTTHGMAGRDPLEGIGRLVSITREPLYTLEAWKEMGGEDGDPIPTEPVYTIALVFDDGREFRWRNASFIKVKTD